MIVTPNLPQHIAIIMDGNGRWAKQKGKLRIFGHRNGIQAVRRTVGFAVKKGIKYLTLYAFSSENWKRPAQEVNALMELFVRALDIEVTKLHKNNIRLHILGDISRFSPSLQKKIVAAEALTATNTGLVLNIAANYGGHWDILQASKRFAEQVRNGQIGLENLTEEYFSQLLVTGSQPAPDLLIRTGGEQRISNFLLWQIAYAELYFSSVLWPDFDEIEFEQALLVYQQRERRFGGCED
ncbi:di-trans,poly-cis-decaprenylcistransferase [Mergibacter septicus]|uniref:Ditrans,polycis-undecaprenyl-diphosphate synthase ((2E,6E)-farnesyl-diphosphate specific) n=1 Tax=Mergibacter septicus TaxID=221402 RepID=A0A8D4LNJ4_9PAST|nr:isoprenyl transferase [Mergibacter septicus]AWX15843.1 di-trans,poly-cis-decaprenylcistransferase [Mergibacter septicus]QDJ13322.1 di-trans,poly-cis-decaprenylcistransferase [Mergibacter septicus]QDJ15096.1 di-trans,poly-cis-decaprenylcistransferase [Mergibacter septicus]UTU47480.1 isoprenyl transferase [Mergibacter septicus]WMR95339.1 isoprenyl transferase [Mergibacter septicus]